MGYCYIYVDTVSGACAKVAKALTDGTGCPVAFVPPTVAGGIVRATDAAPGG
eukprot:gene39458-10456_t